MPPKKKKKKCNKETPHKIKKTNTTNRRQHEKTDPIKNETYYKTKNKTKMSMRGSQSILIFYIIVFIDLTKHFDLIFGLLLL